MQPRRGVVGLGPRRVQRTELTRIAITGARGRLGSALAAAVERSPALRGAALVRWGRPEYDLDDAASAARLVARDRPDLVLHTAAWTDVDACAREPERARRRNGEATGALAQACAAAGAALLVVSTNEVFDGSRTDGRGYRSEDAPRAINPYGASKLAGERAAEDAFAGRPAALTIVRTAWLFGPPGGDFPEKIVLAGRRAVSRVEPLRVVADEVGSPSYSRDVAGGIVELLAAGHAGGTHHLVNAGTASRADWAAEILALAGLDARLERIAAADWKRDSTPPRWAVLDPGDDAPLRPWREALREYLPLLLRDARLGILPQ